MRWRGMDEAQPEQHATLKEALDERRTLMQKYVPEATQALHRRVVEQLQASDAAASALPVGSAAPPFELPDHNGKPVSLVSLIANGPAVLLFFRGRWCPFCIAQLEAWNRLMPSISRSGIALAAVSPQTPHQVSLMYDQHRLEYSLLSDAGNQVARQFGLVYSVPDEQRLIYRRTFVNLPFVNGDESWELPIPATFAIDRGGVVLFSSANPDYTQRPEPAEVLVAVENARSDKRG
jgi:peroxiredoxin